MKQLHHVGMSDRAGNGFLGQFQLTRAVPLRRTFLALLAVCFAAGLGATHAAQPSLQPLVEPGRWPSGSWGGAQDMRVSGNYAYVADSDGGLQVIDVSDPIRPMRVGGWDTPGSAEGVAVSGHHVFVADTSEGLHVIDVSNPTNCVRVGGYVTADDAEGVAVAGSYAYIAARDAGLQIIKVSDPANCLLVGGFDTVGTAYNVAVAGDYAYVASRTGLEVIDVRNPAHCSRVGNYGSTEPIFGVAVSEDTVFITGGIAGMQMLDVSDPTRPVRIGGYSSPSGSAVSVRGGRAYIAHPGGVEVIDVSNPANCFRVGTFRPTRATDVIMDSGRIYVTAHREGLWVLPFLPNVQFTVRVDADPGTPFTLEAATNLSTPNPWSPLVITNVSVMPFDYVDYDVKLSEKPRKFYRVRQP